VALDAAIAADPNPLEYLVWRGLAYARKGDEERAMADYNAVLQVRPNQPYARNNRGVLYLRKGALQSALDDFNAALTTLPGYVLARVNRARVLIANRDFDGALADLAEAQRLDPKSHSESQRCIAYKAMGKYNEAIAECNIVLGNCAQVLVPKPGSLGKALPGHVAAIVDDDGQPLPAGSVGNIAFRRPDPVMLLEYWRRPDATRDKFAGDWLLTGDLGRCDEDGYFWYMSRADDVITSAGYRIGPGEIEDALNGHPAVAMSAVIGVPDPVKTEAIRAFVLLRPGHAGSPELAERIRESVRTRLARHECPRDVLFVESLPLTATGKIMRRELRKLGVDGT